MTAPSSLDLTQPILNSVKITNPVNFTFAVGSYGESCGLTFHMNYSLFVGYIFVLLHAHETGSNTSFLRSVATSSTPSLQYNVSVGPVYWYISASNGYFRSSSSLSHFFFQSCVNKAPDVCFNNILHLLQ